MRQFAIVIVPLAFVCGTAAARAQTPPLVGDTVARALASELSGELAKRNLQEITRHHRIRGSREFRSAADHILDQLRRYGIDARLEQFPTDGTRYYGTQRSRPAWNAEFAELWEVRRDDERVARVARIASFEAMPVTLAQDSESGEALAELVDVGAGTSEADYTGKDVRGKLVMTSSQPGAIVPLAVGARGAAGIVSYAQNQRTAWSGEDENLVRWGHLETFATEKTFAFMISLKQAREWQRRLGRGERVLLHAIVKAGQHPGSYDVVTATIPGGDAARRDEEIVFSCHLDHQRPGANDNASGCVTILEVARTFARLIADGRIPRPARTIRFIWPPEIEGTVTFLNARPEVTARLKAAIHLDMVGGGPQTKSVFRVTRGPASLPSFVNDVAAAIGAFVNEQTLAFASSGVAAYPLVAPEGGREPLLAQLVEFTSGSDHQVYTEGSFGIPAVYLNDWPDRYIHTNFDSPANIDTTKLLRAAFISAATGWVLANAGQESAGLILDLVGPQSVERVATMMRRARILGDGKGQRDQAAEDVPAGPAPTLPAGAPARRSATFGAAASPAYLARFQLWYEQTLVDSISRFFTVPRDFPEHVRRAAVDHLAAIERLVGPVPAPPRPSGDGALVFARNLAPRGPMSVFGFDYFEDRYGAGRSAALAIRRATPLWGSGDYEYEVLNLVDGRRPAQEICDMVSAFYGPVELAAVVQYLRALVEIGVLTTRH